VLQGVWQTYHAVCLCILHARQSIRQAELVETRKAVVQKG